MSAGETSARLAHDEAVRRLSGQMQVLEGIRGRAGTLFGAAALATSFLSSVAAGTGNVNLGRCGWAAVVLFLASTLVTMAMFVSVGGLHFSIQRIENKKLLETAFEDATAAYTEFTGQLEDKFEANSKLMRRYFGGMFVLCALVGAELTLWTFEFVQ